MKWSTILVVLAAICAVALLPACDQSTNAGEPAGDVGAPQSTPGLAPIELPAQTSVLTPVKTAATPARSTPSNAQKPVSSTPSSVTPLSPQAKSAPTVATGQSSQDPGDALDQELNNLLQDIDGTDRIPELAP